MSPEIKVTPINVEINMMWWLFVQVLGDAAGVSTGLHRPGQTSAGPERALWQSAVRL